MKFSYFFWIFCLFSISNSFCQDDPFVVKYNAIKRSQRCYTITDDQTSRVGAIWFTNRIDFSRDTTLNFIVYLGDKNASGADGLAFVIHNDHRDTIDDPTVVYQLGTQVTYQQGAIGNLSGGIGYANHMAVPQTMQISPSVAIEFDTWDNNDVQDGKAGTVGGILKPVSSFKGWDHVSVVYDGNLYQKQQEISDGRGEVGRILPLKPREFFGDHNIEDDKAYHMQLNWVAGTEKQTIELWLGELGESSGGGDLHLIATHTDSIISRVFGGETLLRTGFTGTTGGARNEHTVCLVGDRVITNDDEAITKVNQPIDVNISKNDSYPFPDDEMIVSILDSARHGTIHLFAGSDGSQVIKYAPNLDFLGRDTIKYVVVDMDSDKDYAYKDTAMVFIDVIKYRAIEQPQVIVLQNDSSCLPHKATGAAIVMDSTRTMWRENFNDLPDNTRLDDGESAWNSYVDHSCSLGTVPNPVEVIDGQLRFTETGPEEGCHASWESELISFATADSIFVQYDISNSENLDTDDLVSISFMTADDKEMGLYGYSEVFDGNFPSGTRSGIVVLNQFNPYESFKLVIKSSLSSSDKFVYVDNILISGVQDRTDKIYEWYRGDELLAINPKISNLPSGIYSVTSAYANQDIDKSPPIYFEIVDVSEKPAIAEIEIKPVNSCERANGEIELSMADRPESYLYKWFRSDTVNNGPVLSTDNPARDLIPGTYSALITGIKSGCEAITSAEVLSEKDIPRFEVGKIHLSDCEDSLAGKAFILQPMEGVEYLWYIGSYPGHDTVTAVGDSLVGRAVGHYTVQAFNIESSCISEFINFSIEDHRICDDNASGEKVHLTIPAVSLYQGDSVRIPIMLGGANDLAAFDIFLLWDHSLIEFNSVTSDIFESYGFGFKGDKLWLHWEGDGHVLASNDTFKIFELSISANQDASGELPLIIDKSSSLIDSENSLVNLFTQDGSITILDKVTLTGQVKTISGQPFSLVEILSGKSVAKTDDEGRYQIKLIPYTSSVVTAKLTSPDNVTLLGVNVLDAILLLEHFYGLNAFNYGYQYASADVDGNNTINRADLSELISAFLKIPAKIGDQNAFVFLTSECNDDSNPPFFYKNSYSVQLQSDTSEVDFFAIKLGDVDQSWEASGNLSTSENKGFNLIIEETIDDNNVVDFLIKSADPGELLGLQLIIKWENDDLLFDQFENIDLNFNVNQNLLEQEMLPMVWIAEDLKPKKFLENQNLFRLRFKQQNLRPEISLHLAEEGGNNLALTSNKELLDLNIYRRENITEISELEYSPVQLFPNPADHTLNVKVTSPKEYFFEIIDLGGKCLKKGTIKNSSKIDIDALKEGIYFFKIEDLEGNQTIQKLVKKN